MRRQLLPALRMFLVMTLLTGFAYTAVITGIATVLFPEQAAGSLVEVEGEVVGSRLIGQEFTARENFHPRPSAVDFNGTGSGASNLGPANQELIALIAQRVADYRALNGLAASTTVPIDAVTSSGSGLDPHISIANARLQANRVAETRGLPLDQVLELIDEHTIRPQLGFLSEPVVDVLGLNLALEDLA
ncbi:MAG TPA: potassium-transporting ATPase subunit KdpC [Acidimicrobiia bacterium]|nr:potassium-transporting ATPase subunit KdpC [Acidimicrobiia bacterium]